MSPNHIQLSHTDSGLSNSTLCSWIPLQEAKSEVPVLIYIHKGKTSCKVAVPKAFCLAYNMYAQTFWNLCKKQEILVQTCKMICAYIGERRLWETFHFTSGAKPLQTFFFFFYLYIICPLYFTFPFLPPIQGASPRHKQAK